ncbi:MAG: M20/M25/M40 family metallo-hydrolase, partial [Pseudomonadota bacterium]|nr:M20/M25/M40 family metallo-hydrolase [Pseudomonadota bacterium]
ACGHDAHTAMLLGAAMALKRHEAELIAKGGAVRLFFQPAEEGGAGAKAMIDEGAIRGADAAIMLHVGSGNDAGHFQSGRGRTNCSCHTFHIGTSPNTTAPCSLSLIARSARLTAALRSSRHLHHSHLGRGRARLQPAPVEGSRRRGRRGRLGRAPDRLARRRAERDG